MQTSQKDNIKYNNTQLSNVINEITTEVVNIVTNQLASQINAKKDVQIFEYEEIITEIQKGIESLKSAKDNFSTFLKSNSNNYISSMTDVYYKSLKDVKGSYLSSYSQSSTEIENVINEIIASIQDKCAKENNMINASLFSNIYQIKTKLSKYIQEFLQINDEVKEKYISQVDNVNGLLQMNNFRDKLENYFGNLNEVFEFQKKQDQIKINDFSFEIISNNVIKSLENVTRKKIILKRNNKLISQQNPGLFKQNVDCEFESCDNKIRSKSLKLNKKRKYYKEAFKMIKRH